MVLFTAVAIFQYSNQLRSNFIKKGLYYHSVNLGSSQLQISQKSYSKNSMLDYIKIRPNICPSLWAENVHLEFNTTYNETTGEVKRRKVAKYRGLTFSIITELDGSEYCELDGSLPVYYFGANTKDLNYNQLLMVFQEFEHDFNVDADAQVVKLELGAGVRGKHDAQKFIKSILSDGRPTHTHTGLKSMSSVSVGMESKRTGVIYKAYDKGKQANTKDTNFLRFEVRIKHARIFERLGVKQTDKPFTVADMLKIETLQTITNDLLKQLDKFIVYDREIKLLRKISEKKRLKFINLLNRDVWLDYNHTQIKVNRKFFDNNAGKYGNYDLKNDTLELLKNKLANLLISAPCDLTAEKKVCITTVDESSQNFDTGRNFEAETNQKEIKPKPKQIKHCSVCGADVSEKKASAKYCSKKCSNQSGNLKRKQNRKQNLVSERKHLADVFLLLENKAEFEFYYLRNDRQRRVKSSSESMKKKPLDWSIYRKVIQVEIQLRTGTVKLTRLRAKQVFKYFKTNQV